MPYRSGDDAAHQLYRRNNDRAANTHTGNKERAARRTTRPQVRNRSDVVIRLVRRRTLSVPRA
jgi:hypothetical protein